MATVDAAARPRHAPIGGNVLRASVLGANDGLVSNLSLIMGVAGAGLESRVIPDPVSHTPLVVPVGRHLGRPGATIGDPLTKEHP